MAYQDSSTRTPSGATTRQVEGIKAKIARALTHLSTLDEKLRQYFETHPVGLQPQVDQSQETCVFVLQVCPTPLELSVLAGEIAYQLRSAVDHIANGLVVAAGNVPTRRTSFPVLVKRSLGSLKIDGSVSEEALVAVESVQPYQQPEPDTHPLQQASQSSPHHLVASGFPDLSEGSLGQHLARRSMEGTASRTRQCRRRVPLGWRIRQHGLGRGIQRQCVRRSGRPRSVAGEPLCRNPVGEPVSICKSEAVTYLRTTPPGFVGLWPSGVKPLQ